MDSVVQLSSTNATTLSIAALSHEGRVRKHNEDYIGYHQPQDPGLLRTHGVLMVICDGVGGAAAGEIASEQAVHRILNEYYETPREDDVEARLLSAIAAANDVIYLHNLRSQSDREMATTVVAATWLAEYLVVAYAGDSRAYLVRNGQITQLTRDHSWVAEMVRSGDLTPEEAEQHPWRSRITRGLGMQGDVHIDIGNFATAVGDILVLCSDGLTRHVNDDEIADIVTQYPDIRAVRRLVDLANLRGGKDNISVIVAEWLPEDMARERRQQGLLDEAETVFPTSAGRDRKGLPLPLPLALAGIVIGVMALLAAFAIVSRNGGADQTPTPTAAITRIAPPALAQPVARSPSARQGIVNADMGLLVRETPGINGTTVANLALHELVTITGWHRVAETGTKCSPGLWLLIATPAGDSGWVCANHVLLEGQPANNEGFLRALGLPELPVPSPTPSATSTKAPSPTLTLTATPSPSPSVTPTATNAASPTTSPTTTPLGASGPVLVLSATAAITGDLPFALSPNLDKVATSANDDNRETMVLWTLASKSDSNPQRLPVEADIKILAFLADGKQIATGLGSGGLRWYSLEPESQQKTLATGVKSAIVAVASLSKPDRLIVAFESGQTQIWNLGEDTPYFSSIAIGGVAIAHLAGSSDAPLFASADNAGTVQLWSLYENTVYPKENLLFASPDLNGIALSADGRSLVDGRKPGGVSLRHTGTGDSKQLPNASSNTTAVAISKDGKLVAAGADDGTITVWQVSDLKSFSSSGLQGKPIVALAFSTDRQRLAAVEKDGIVQIWTMASDE